MECPAPSPGYLPSCWRAGEIIRDRCLSQGTAETICQDREVQTRKAYVERGMAGQVDVSVLNVVQRAEMDRTTSFFSTGGLIATHASSRSRGDIWSAIQARNVYGKSGDRILL